VWLFETLDQRLRPLGQRPNSPFLRLNVALLNRLGFRVSEWALAQWIKKARWSVYPEGGDST
jgi:hypothetical protein